MPPLVSSYSSNYYKVFHDVDTTTCILYVPKGSKNTYQAADQWKAFVNIEEIENISLSAFRVNVAATEGSLVSANPQITARTATVTIPGTGFSDQTIIVTQAAGPAQLSLSASTLNIGGPLIAQLRWILHRTPIGLLQVINHG